MSTWIETPGGQRVATLTEPATVIGRDRRAADLGFDDELLSRRHCCLILDGEAPPWILDLNSTNHTRVNGTSVEQSRLQEGSRLQLGGVELILRHDPDAPPPDPPEASGCRRLAEVLENPPVDRASYRARRAADSLAASAALLEASLSLLEVPPGADHGDGLARVAADLLDADRAFLLSPDHRLLGQAADPGRREASPPLSLARRLAELCQEEARVVLSRNLLRDPRVIRRGERLAGLEVGSALAAPLGRADQPGGCLYLDRAPGNEWFCEGDRLMVVDLVPFLGAALGSRP